MIVGGEMRGLVERKRRWGYVNNGVARSRSKSQRRSEGEVGGRWWVVLKCARGWG